MPLTDALVAFECVRLWFAQWTLRHFSAALTFPVNLGLFVQMFVLVLLATSCLPDDPEDDCDLTVFHETRCQYF